MRDFTAGERGERGYPWININLNAERITTIVAMLLLIGVATAIFIVYSRLSNDVSPDSVAGYGYAFTGSALLVLAAIGYTRQRRSNKREIGKLNNALNWHICFAIVGIVLLFMHSFGNFNPRTGTYALYGMVALVISGFIGRALDQLMPRLITEEVRKALTNDGEDRIESISQRLQSIVVHNTLEIRGFNPGKMANNLSMPGISSTPPQAGRNNRKSPTGKVAAVTPGSDQSMAGILQSPWDLAYITLEETPQEINRDPQQYRFVPDRKSPLATPGALLPGAQEHIIELAIVQQALKREQFFRYTIRYWRIFHVFLALTTVLLTLWHIEYALQLLIPTFFRH
jgi:hypothetical protein